MIDVKNLENSPFHRDAMLPRPEHLATWPAVTLFMMVKNAESCIGRALNNLVAPDGRPYISDVAMILNDTTDNTRRIVEEFCLSKNLPHIISEVTSRTHPELYIQDTAASYSMGPPLAGEKFGGPFTEAPLLADWAAARNTLWTTSGSWKGKWRLFLDADDVIQDPESLLGLCMVMEREGIEQACTRYLFDIAETGQARGSSFRERITRNTQSIRWIYPIHEVLAGSLRTAHIDGNLVVVDKRDNKGTGIRVPGRNFKVLYNLARRSDWDVSPRILVNLIMETRLIVGGSGIERDFVESLLNLYLQHSTWAEERAWAMSMVGEVLETCHDYHAAVKLYEASLQEHPGAKSAFRLCRARFYVGDYSGCVAAYELGIENKVVHQSLDEGVLYEDSSKILVASALDELGQHDRAREMCRAAISAFPMNDALRELGDKLGV